MTLDPRVRRRRAGLWVALLMSVAPPGAWAAEAPRTGPAAQARGDEVDAEVLRDLEVLNNPNYARDREIAKRMSFFERMRALQTLPAANSQPPADGSPPPGATSKWR